MVSWVRSPDAEPVLWGIGIVGNTVALQASVGGSTPPFSTIFMKGNTMSKITVNYIGFFCLGIVFYHLAISLVWYFGDWESLVNPSALGAEDPQFESEISDQFRGWLIQR